MQNFLAAIPDRPDQLNTDWLTACLRHQGILTSGVVSNLSIQPLETWHHASIAFVTVGYDDRASKRAPRQLFIKIADQADPLAAIFPGEIAFYENAQTQKLPLAQCYAALRKPNSNITCLILEDLRATHRETPWPSLPSFVECQSAIIALAQLHAHWWGDNGLSEARTSLPRLPNEVCLYDYFAGLLEDFFASAGTALSQTDRALIATTVSRLADLKSARLTHTNSVTRTHGDPHFWNVLYPNDSPHAHCIFVDWEDWREDIGAADLAAMLSLHLPTGRRRNEQTALLQTYLQALNQRVSTHYHWEQLMDDYRLGILQTVVVPIYQHHAASAGDPWRELVRRWLAACADLNCGELL